MSNYSYNEKVILLIETNLKRIVIGSPNIFNNDIEIVVGNERYIESELTRNEPNRIYVVVQFLESAITAGHTVQPIQLVVLSEHDNLSKVQTLLRTFAEIYNTKLNDDGSITQFYLTPVLLSAFNEVYDGYRGLYTLNGTLLISPNANHLTNVNVYNELTREWEELELLSSDIDYTIQLSPDTYFDEKGQTKAHAIQATLTINLVFYLTDNNYLTNAILDDAFNETLNAFTTFKFNFVYKNKAYNNIEMQLANFLNSNKLGQLPLITITLTRGK